MVNKRGNKFRKVLKHLKSSQIEEKIKSLNEDLKKTGILYESPTNSTSGLYQQGDTDYEIDLKVQKARKLKSVKAVFPDS